MEGRDWDRVLYNGIGVVSRYRWWPRDLYYPIKSTDLTKRRDRSRGRCRSREDRELVMAQNLKAKQKRFQ